MVPLTGNRDQRLASQVESNEMQMSPTKPAPQPSPSIELVASGIVLIIAFGGMSMNFFALSGALAETTAGSFRIGSYSGAQISALTAIFAEITLGAILMDSRRVTQLLPAIGALPKRYRILLTVVSLTCLLALAASELYLIHLAGSWYGAGPRYPLAEWLPLTFVPLALAFVAMPLDSFVTALRALLPPNPAPRR